MENCNFKTKGHLYLWVFSKVGMLSLIVSMLLMSCGNPSTLEDVKVPKNIETPCVIYFDSDNCGWCTKFKPNWESVSNDTTFKDITFYENRSGYLFGIRGVPAVVLIDKNNVVKKVVGYHSESKFRENVSKLLPDG